MMEFIWFLAGLLLGGCVIMVFLCGMQFHRLQDYEQTIKELREELNNKE